MKKTTTQSCLAFLTGIATFAPLCPGFASDTNATSSDAAAPVTAAAPAPVISSAPSPGKLPYGVEDVLKLSRAQIGEEIILNYVQNSGTIYNLAPKDIVYLRDQGVSDKVINAMLSQRQRVELAAVQSAQAAQAVQNAQNAPNAPTAPDAGAAPPAPYADQGATYAEAPLTPPASSAYVVPYSGASYPYYGPYYYPYYYGPAYYGGWYGPSIGFGFRFGGRGGFHGGHGFGGHGGGHR
jgi:hypothetical protein